MNSYILIGGIIAIVSLGISSVSINIISLALSVSSFAEEYIFESYIDENTFIVPCYCYNMIEGDV